MELWNSGDARDRGDHYHAVRREILVVMVTDWWSLHWDEGAYTAVWQRNFDGPEAVLITVPIGLSHAICNDGTVPIRMVGMSDRSYDPDRPDAYSRIVVPVTRCRRRAPAVAGRPACCGGVRNPAM